LTAEERSVARNAGKRNGSRAALAVVAGIIRIAMENKWLMEIFGATTATTSMATNARNVENALNLELSIPLMRQTELNSASAMAAEIR
jgi:hypothetical protein